MEKKESWYKVEIRELIRKNLDKIHRKVGDSYGIDVSFLHKMISEYAEQELDKAREEVVREIISRNIDRSLDIIKLNSEGYRIASSELEILSNELKDKYLN